jgi:hypothetical protein
MQTTTQLARRRLQPMLALMVGIVVAVGGLMAIGHLTAAAVTRSIPPTRRSR